MHKMIALSAGCGRRTVLPPFHSLACEVLSQQGIRRRDAPMRKMSALNCCVPSGVLLVLINKTVHALAA